MYLSTKSNNGSIYWTLSFLLFFMDWSAVSAVLNLTVKLTDRYLFKLRKKGEKKEDKENESGSKELPRELISFIWIFLHDQAASMKSVQNIQ